MQHVLITVGTPRANGLAERVTRTITPMLAKLMDTPEKWDRVLFEVEFVINNTMSRSTGKSPSELLFGVSQRDEINDQIRLKLEAIQYNKRDLVKMRDEASENIKIASM